MELLAAITGLEAIKTPDQEVLIWSDSKYVIDTIEKKWIYGWMKKGFSGKKNKDLWLRFMAAYTKHKVKFKWVKGHAGHIENERCDELAVQASKDKVNQLIDSVFEVESQKSLL